MQKCPVCNGRVVITATGTKCMNSSCEGAKEAQPEDNSVKCRCGEPMHYKGLNSWGEPNYVCMACGSTTKL